MHYEVQFSGTQKERDEQAKREVYTWLGLSGIRRLKKCARIVKPQRTRQRVQTAKMFCDFNGIGGRNPVRAVIRLFLEIK